MLNDKAIRNRFLFLAAALAACCTQNLSAQSPYELATQSAYSANRPVKFASPPTSSDSQLPSGLFSSPGPLGNGGLDGMDQQPYFDLDAYLDSQPHQYASGRGWHLQLLPNNLIYKSYLAGAKEPRMGAQVVSMRHDGWIWDATLGGRVGLLRYGDDDPIFPQGIQVDAEGAAQVRLDVTDDVNVRSVDFRGGVPVSFGWGRQQTKLAYYHMSAHLGDEFLLGNPGFNRLNWSRDALVLGHSVYLTQSLRVYGEVGWAFHMEITDPWEFQFGVDWAPVVPTGVNGSPFLAVNTHLLQEVNYGGNLNVQAGWAWVSDRDRHMLRLGLQYYNGKSAQYSFYDDFETQIGFGVWYDF